MLLELFEKILATDILKNLLTLDDCFAKLGRQNLVSSCLFGFFELLYKLLMASNLALM